MTAIKQTKSRLDPKAKLAFHLRLSRLDKLPKDYINQVVKLDHKLNLNRIENVRYGRTIDLEILSLLEKINAEVK